MPSIVPPVRYAVKQRLLRNLRRCRQAGLRLRYLIVINLLEGRAAYATADVLGVHNTTVYRVAKRFRDQGEWGLLDGRERAPVSEPRCQEPFSCDEDGS